MKLKTSLLALMITTKIFAGVSDEIFIQGKIGNEFDDKKVKVTDNLGQTYFLNKSIFPKDFKFKQGESFSIEVQSKDIENVKIIKKK